VSEQSTAQSTAPSTAQPVGTAAHDPEVPVDLRAAMVTGWAPEPAQEVATREVAPYAAKRREQLSAGFLGRTLVVPSGVLRPRANDTDYPFRAASDYAWLTGDTEPDGVLVMVPEATGHRATLYVQGRSDRSSTGFFTDRRYGELWVGPRPGVCEVASALAIETAGRGELPAVLTGLAGALTVRGVDPGVDAALPPNDDDDVLARTLSELRLVKDDWEIGQLEAACEATARGFADCLAELPEAKATSERWIEGTFWRRARVEGNDVGYGSIVAAGHHATTLHWVVNDGPVRDGQLLLLDMGVEVDSLYTADVTRTVPVSGRFTPVQRRVYEAVWEAQQAGLAACAPGAAFLDPHRAAMRVLATRLREWGLLPVEPGVSLVEDPASPGAGLHRRYTLHGTSHMLGLDVHDCAQARDECYRDGVLAAGMVLTVEPGLYFQRDDLTVPEELRGIGVRIEDDVLITADGHRVLSGMLPTRADEVERWITGVS
jgi:Xaa-Pro aminopeptidase